MTKKFTIRRVHNAPRTDSLTLVEEILFQVHFGFPALRRNWKESFMRQQSNIFASPTPETPSALLVLQSAVLALGSSLGFCPAYSLPGERASCRGCSQDRWRPGASK